MDFSCQKNHILNHISPKIIFWSFGIVWPILYLSCWFLTIFVVVKNGGSPPAPLTNNKFRGATRQFFDKKFSYHEVCRLYNIPYDPVTSAIIICKFWIDIKSTKPLIKSWSRVFCSYSYGTYIIDGSSQDMLRTHEG